MVSKSSEIFIDNINQILPDEYYEKIKYSKALIANVKKKDTYLYLNIIKSNVIYDNITKNMNPNSSIHTSKYKIKYFTYF
jgi:hypothetical protein